MIQVIHANGNKDASYLELQVFALSVGVLLGTRMIKVNACKPKDEVDFY